MWKTSSSPTRSTDSTTREKRYAEISLWPGATTASSSFPAIGITRRSFSMPKSFARNGSMTVMSFARIGSSIGLGVSQASGMSSSAHRPSASTTGAGSS